MTPLLSVRDLSVEYRGIGWVNRAVNGVSLDVPAGKVVGLVGESGSGKSTIALAVLGLVRRSGRITSGSVRLEGRELLTLQETEWRQVRGAQIGLVTQNPRGSLDPIMRVGDQIAAVYRAHTGASPNEAGERAIELLRLVGINDPARRIDAYPEELSGGMAQRVLIAMALSCSPKLLVADEPTSGLDVTVQARVLDDLAGSVEAVGSSLLLITQDFSIVANYCDHVYFLHAGEVTEHAPTVDFFERPHHPGSAALLAVTRHIGNDQFRLRGLPVDGRALPPGCYLEPRCPFADTASGCSSVHPKLTWVGTGHQVRCHRAPVVYTAWTEEMRRRNVGVS